MKFSTPVPLYPEKEQLSYHSNILLFGSCFSNHIGNKLHYYKFKSLSNPFGIVFQPPALEKLIVRAIDEISFTKEDLFFLNERWHCFETHSQCSSTDATVMLERLNTSLKVTHNFLRTSSHIIITLGTAWVYRHLETDAWVANCHKVPQKKFAKELLSVVEIKESLEAIVSLIRLVNPKVQLIFTVSPVRHLKDGFVENQRSKAHLIAAVHELVAPGKHQHYFPAYELMMDELRDYRFYAEDMIHPNQTAINFIWEQFQKVWIAEETSSTMKTVASIQAGLAHKPFDLNSVAHLDFKTQLQEKINTLTKAYPFIKF
ncbi:GSCFA domain-containing protein [Ascidiimonas sp. W6]|uniref:GSCFA domain-containing protein n=1 Tax=Ascidiimonas meishanensis TaxID=3128903 RepID=UPI0030EF2FAC